MKIVHHSLNRARSTLLSIRLDSCLSLIGQARIQLFRQGVQSWIYRRNVALSLVNYWPYSQTPIGPYTLHRYLRLFHSKCNRPTSKRLWSIDHIMCNSSRWSFSVGPDHFFLSQSHKSVSLSSSTVYSFQWSGQYIDLLLQFSMHTLPTILDAIFSSAIIILFLFYCTRQEGGGV